MAAKSNAPRRVFENLWKGFLKTFWIHLIPLGCCIVLICLDRLQVFWFRNNRPITLNALQLAAKLLELFILASISAMILHRARKYLVVDEKGLPFGLLAAIYRATDFMLVFEASFWYGVFSNKKTFRLGIPMLLVAFYSVLVGPSCAILMIPTPDFYPHKNAFESKPARLLFFAPEQDFESASARTKDYMYPANIFGNATSGETYDNVLKWAWNDLGYSFGLSNLSTVYEPNTRFMYQAVSSLVNDGQIEPRVISAASVPHKSLVQAVGQLWNDFQLPVLTFFDLGTNVTANRTVVQFYASEDTPVFEPVVQAKCTFLGDSRKTNSSDFVFSADGMLSFNQGQGWSVQQDTSWPIPQTSVDKTSKTLNGSLPINEVQYSVEWIDAAAVNASGSFSVAALISAPLDASEGSDANNEGVSLLVPCVLSAYWMPATFLLDPQTTPSVISNWSSSSTNPMAEAIQAVQNGKQPNTILPRPLALVNISADWASELHGIDGLLLDMLNPLEDSINYPKTDSAQSSPQRAWTLLSEIVPGFAAAFAIGLANFGADPTVSFFNSRSNSVQDFRESSLPLVYNLTLGSFSVPSNASGPLPDIYEISVKVNRYGYAFGARTATVKFGFAIVIIYVALLAMYALHALVEQLITHYPHSITSFGGSHDIITLAMNSQPPPELADCGAGVQNRNTWKHYVKVRANGEEDKCTQKLELVFPSRQNMDMVQPGQKYG